MSSANQPLLRFGAADAPAHPPHSGASLIGEILIEMGDLAPGDMVKAAAVRTREDARFGEILVANHMVSEAALYRALARQYGCDVADLTAPHPDIRLIETIGPAFCVQHGIIPWKRVGAVSLIATSRPNHFAALKPDLPLEIGNVLMVVAPECDIHSALLRTSHRALADRSEARVDQAQSCRGWDGGALARRALVLVFLLVAWAVAAPKHALMFLTGWAVIALFFNTTLKAAAAWATFGSARQSRAHFASSRRDQPALRLPKISILVPLYREREIARRLVRRLNRLNYPRELLDIWLIVEQDDSVTRPL